MNRVTLLETLDIETGSLVFLLSRKQAEQCITTLECALASRLLKPLQSSPVCTIHHGQCSESAVKDTSHILDLTKVGEEGAQVREFGVVGIIKPRRDGNRIIGVEYV